MADYKNMIYKLFQNYNIYGSEALYYISFYIYNIKFNSVDLSNFDSLEKCRVDFVGRYNIFSSLDVRKLDLQTINKLDSIIKDYKINKQNFIDEFFRYYIENDNLINVKEYSKFYNNDKLADWIINLIKPTTNIDIYDGNIKINSFTEKLINSSNYNKIYGNQPNQIIYDLIIFNIFLKNNINLSKQISTNDILYNDIISKVSNNDSSDICFYDLIIYDFSNSQHNIIHANCCSKIKKLKIRGTKYEPLLLQLIMMSLNKNGKALIIVPDILLFGDSSQAIESRKYLIENFNIKKICQLDESLLDVKSIKKSIIYFENNGTTTNINFTKLNFNLEEENILTVNINQLKQNDYSLYCKMYKEIKVMPKELKFIQVNKLFEFKNNNNQKCLMINKYYKSTESVKFLVDSELKSSDVYYLVLKSNNTEYIDDFLFYYVENILNRKINLYIKGKMNQIDTNKVLNIDIPILPLEIQQAVCNYYTMINNISKNIIIKIDMYQNLVNEIFKTIPNNNITELSNICTLYIDSNHPTNNKLIGVIKNGLSAGCAYLNNKELSNNSYYLEVTDNNFLLEYVYYWLKFNKNKLSELSNLTSQTNLNKTNLLSFNIPIIDLTIQKNIILYSETFYNLIDKHNLELITIKETDIMNIINSIHKL